MTAIGLDIGTTSICVIAADAENGNILFSETLPNNAEIHSEIPFERLQNAETILKISETLLNKALVSLSEPPVSIGISGQMHGILYIDKDGNSVSPLYYWQDGRGGEDCGGKTYAEVYSELCGIPAATGYGNVTHFYNEKNGLVPENAVKYLTVHDYVGMKLCGKTKPLTHISDAASLGGFDLKKGGFTVKNGLQPEVTPDLEILGRYKNIPVTVAIGDNQASFIGSGGADDCVLLNVGTGSQVSVTAKGKSGGGFEIRPLTGDDKIAVGAILCGGKSYNLLESFFADVCRSMGFEPGRLYDKMDELADGDTSLSVNTKFMGTRQNPLERGVISGISTGNFTARDLTLGVLNGMADEMFSLYKEMAAEDGGINRIIGSGNGIRRNKPLCRIIKEKFKKPLFCPAHTEEAAYGAALTGLVAAGVFKDLRSACSLIKYIEL